MRPSIPNSKAVESAFRTLEKKIATSRKKINIAAAKATKADDYEIAKEWMAVGSSLGDFAARVTAFSTEWKRVVRAAKITSRADRPVGTASKATTRSKQTPVWKFCTPALKAILSRGGTAEMSQVLADLQANLATDLTDRDTSIDVTRGTPKWHRTVRRAYRQSQREGWIEKRRDGIWKLTAKGKITASGGASES